jgi:hypothetical protein
MFAEIPAWFDWIFIIGIAPFVMWCFFSGLNNRKISLSGRILLICIGVFLLADILFKLIQLLK